MWISQKTAKPCIACTKLTKFICLDCSTDGKGFVPLCLDPQCKKEHELEHVKEHASN